MPFLSGHDLHTWRFLDKGHMQGPQGRVLSCSQYFLQNLMDLGSLLGYIRRFHKIRNTFLGVPIIWIMVFWGLYCGPPILGHYHIYIRDYIKLCGFVSTVYRGGLNKQKKEA